MFCHYCPDFLHKINIKSTLIKFLEAKALNLSLNLYLIQDFILTFKFNEINLFSTKENSHFQSN